MSEKLINCSILRYTMVFIFYALGTAIMLIIRPIIAKKFLPKKGKFTIYAALYFYPILALLHAVGGGIICKSSNLHYLPHSLRVIPFPYFINSYFYRLFIPIYNYNTVYTI